LLQLEINIADVDTTYAEHRGGHAELAAGRLSRVLHRCIGLVVWH
jgi:hypothetical protein